MTFGHQLKALRKANGVTQEMLAEELNVSRSAIAKWEADKGMPDISNLKALAGVLHVSIDVLLTDDSEVISPAEVLKENNYTSYLSGYAGNYCDIDLTGWNDGVSDVLLTGEDRDFLFYQKPVKNRNVSGMLGKRYITQVKVLKTANYSEPDNVEMTGRDYFCGKHVFLELACREGFVKGFFDFRSDDYLDVRVHSITETKVRLEFGREIEICTITKIEELE